jgi:hypothetical protein
VKTFPGWRAVGRAMRWARQQDGVRQEIEHAAVARQHRWYGPGRDGSIVGVTWGGPLTHDVDIYVAGGGEHELVEPTAAQALRVLAAFDLIPAELAEVASC